MKKNITITTLLTLFLTIINNGYAQNLNDQYNIKIWNKDIQGNYVENNLQTLGFLPVSKNTRDEITIGNIKKIYESFLNIQIIQDKEDNIIILLDYKNDIKNYKKEITVQNKEIKDMEDFKIQIEKNKNI